MTQQSEIPDQSKFDAPTIPEGIGSLRFPSLELEHRILKLPIINTSPTDIKGLTSIQIVQYALHKPGGIMIIDLSGATQPEIEAINGALLVGTANEANEIIPVIEIIDKDLSMEQKIQNKIILDGILRDVNREILGDGTGSSPGAIAFNEFIQTLFPNDPNQNGYQEQLVFEWNEFMVKHDISGKAKSPWEIHSFENVGLLTPSKGDDPLREPLVQFVMKTMNRYRPEAMQIYNHPDKMIHSYDPDDKMNEFDGFLMAMGMTLYSNFARGAGVNGIRRGQDYIGAYPLRALAAEKIAEVNNRFQPPNNPPIKP